MLIAESGGGGADEEPRDASDAPPLIPGLPDDISARVIAFLPVSSHSSLSLVSSSWLRLLRRSPLPLFRLRSSLRPPEPILLLSIRTPSNPSLWFIIHPPVTVLPLPSPPLPSVGSASCAAGHVLYLLGGSHPSSDGLPSRAVQILDPRTRSWRHGPPLSYPREFSAASSISGRIYAAGGRLPSLPGWAETLDPSTNRWSPLPSPEHLRDKWMHGCAALGGKFLAVADRGGVMFDPGTNEWAPVSPTLDMGWKGRAAAVAGILYSYDYLGKIKGYDPARDKWRPVEGLERSLPKFLCGATLTEFGRLLCVVWESGTVKQTAGTTRKRNAVGISSAGIEISRMEDGGLKGSVVWKEEGVLAAARGSTIAHCVSVEV